MKAFFRYLTTLLLLSMIGIVVLIAQKINSNTPNDLSGYIPSNAIFSIRIDGKTFVLETINAFLNAEDQSEIDEISEMISENRQEDGESGIDVLNEVVVFSFPIKETELNGFLFHISNNEQFDKYRLVLQEKEIGSATNEDLGIIILNNKQKQFDAETLSLQASQILFAKPKKDNPPVKEELHIELSKGIERLNGTLLQGKITMQPFGSEVIIGGSVELNTIPRTKNSKCINGNDLKMDIPAFSNAISDSVTEILSSFDLDAYHLSGLSVNYRGLTIEEVPSLKLQPDFDALLYFETETNIDSLRKDLLELNDQFLLTVKGFNYGNARYFMRQVDDRTVYIGRSPYKETLLEDRDENLVFEIDGKLQYLTALQGDGMMRKFVELLSLYSASKNFTNSTESIHYRIMRNSEDSGTIDGKIIFKNERTVHMSLIHFLLQSKLID